MRRAGEWEGHRAGPCDHPHVAACSEAPRTPLSGFYGSFLPWAGPVKALAIAPQGQPPAPLSSQEVRGWLRAPPANQSHISLTKAKLCSLRKFRRFSELCVRNWMKTKHPCFSSRVSTGGCGQDGLIKPEIPSPQGSTKKQNASKKSQEQERNDDSGLSAPGHGTPRGWGRGPEAAWHLGTC